VKKSGAHKVIVIDNNDFRLNLAKELGADVAIHSERENVNGAIMDLTGGRGADLVCQTAAYVDPTVEQYMALATELVRPMGILVFQGDFLHPINIHLHRWHHEALDVRCIAFRHYSKMKSIDIIHHSMYWQDIQTRCNMNYYTFSFIDLRCYCYVSSLRMGGR
jgi:threonine dehydrogenase-like Zn-dependent dehydrogenase